MSREQPIEITRAMAERLARKVKFDDTASWNALRDLIERETACEISGWRLDKLTDWVMEAWLKLDE